MKRIVFIASSLWYGGAEKMLSFVANGLCRAGYSITILNLMEHKERMDILDEKIRVIDIRTGTNRILNKLSQIFQLSKNIRKEKPNLIISFKFTPNYLASFLGKILRIPVIISERCDPSAENGTSWKDKLYWRMINSADGGVFQTRNAMNCYSQKMRQRGTVIPNPIMLKENIIHTVRPNESTGVIVSVGRLSNRQKRYDILLEAFGRFHTNYPGFILKLYGDGEDENLIRKWIDDFELKDSVFLEGRTDTPLQAMDNADIFIMTSDYEGISNSLLEAMAIGMPVIATDCTPGGARLLIKDDKCGLLVPCGKPDLIAAALEKMVGDYQFRKECSRNARYVLSDYNPDRIIKLWGNYILKFL